MKIDEMVKANPHITNDRVLVIDGEGWHQGVIGIVAAKVKEFFGKPTVIISRDGEEAKARAEVLRDFPFVMRFLPARIYLHIAAVTLWRQDFH